MAPTTATTAQPFSLRIERLSAGKSEALLAQADELEMRIKVYAEGGENTLHAHLDHDHAFVVLDGQATFYDRDETETVVGKYQGIMLPRGTHYHFCNSGEGNLVLLRPVAATSRSRAMPAPSARPGPAPPGSRPKAASEPA